MPAIKPLFFYSPFLFKKCEDEYNYSKSARTNVIIQKVRGRMLLYKKCENECNYSKSARTNVIIQKV